MIQYVPVNHWLLQIQVFYTPSTNCLYYSSICALSENKKNKLKKKKKKVQIGPGNNTE